MSISPLPADVIERNIDRDVCASSVPLPSEVRREVKALIIAVDSLKAVAHAAERVSAFSVGVA